MSCMMTTTEPHLPGKIAIEYLNHQCRIYENSDSAHIGFTAVNNDSANYGGFTWLNQRDALVGCEYIEGNTRDDYKGNVVVFNLKGQIVERLYEAQKGEIAGFTYPSRLDKYLLFTEQKVGSLKINPIEGLMRQNSILIMDLQNRQIIKKLENLGSSPNFEINESPWLYDENHFIYSISTQNGIQAENISQPKNDPAGIYICNLNTDQKKLLIPDARLGVCSPADVQIAYIKDQSIWIMNLKTNSKQILYKGGSGQKFRNIHWTPDGKYIYVAYFNDYPFNFFTADEKLIEVSTKKAISFKKIGQGFEMYTWK